ncbi:MAG TPA: hypothetical protein PLD25_18745 [Chloroflexota bacterium]|nr:hypothetical protein [Chloroflexota bacterium]HUM70102.1 hypothetical protein [Chloroflexota bacterium]
MNEFQATGVLMILFALRCLVPAALIFGVGYLMNWLVDRWNREDAARAQAQGQYCPAYYRYGDCCWSKRMTAEGALPAVCVNCPIYRQAIKPV